MNFEAPDQAHLDSRRKLLQSLLADEGYHQAHARWKAIGKRNAPWYAPYSAGALNLETLADHLVRAGEYQAIYRSLCKATHSANVDRYGLVGSSGGVKIAPLGLPLGVENLCVLLGNYVLAVGKVIEDDVSKSSMASSFEWFASEGFAFRKRLSSDAPLSIERAL